MPVNTAAKRRLHKEQREVFAGRPQRTLLLCTTGSIPPDQCSAANQAIDGARTSTEGVPLTGAASCGTAQCRLIGTVHFRHTDKGHFCQSLLSHSRFTP
jgi:hypothetical protein